MGGEGRWDGGGGKVGWGEERGGGKVGWGEERGREGRWDGGRRGGGREGRWDGGRRGRKGGEAEGGRRGRGRERGDRGWKKRKRDKFVSMNPQVVISLYARPLLYVIACFSTVFSQKSKISSPNLFSPVSVSKPYIYIIVCTCVSYMGFRGCIGNNTFMHLFLKTPCPSVNHFHP